MTAAENIRNLAIIAHIDHGKTTLIDAIFRSAQTFESHRHVAQRVMDDNELERERSRAIPNTRLPEASVRQPRIEDFTSLQSPNSRHLRGAG